MAPPRPYTFPGLRKMTRSAVALEATMLDYFTARPLFEGFLEELGALLQHYLKEPCKLVPPESKTVRGADLAAILPSLGCLALIGLAPGERKIIAELDMGLASLSIERLLGGTGQCDRILRPLTELEQGVLSFLVLKMLGAFHEGLQTGHELALTLDGFATSPAEVSSLFAADEELIMLGVRVSVGRTVGYARIFLPGSIIGERFGKSVPQSGARAPARVYLAALAETLGDMPIEARVEVAALPDLSVEDIAQLEVGDIIVIEHHGISSTTGSSGLSGQVFVKLDAGKNGSLVCRLCGDSEQHLEIVDFVIKEEPEEEPMAIESTGDEPAAEENLAETEGLLRDVAAPVVVELGRLRMNVAQVVRLRKGQILRLARAPGDPVDLVVNGRLFGRGELIDVEGELGIRIVQIVGAP